MRVREDGSIQPSSLPTYQNAGRSEDYALYRCMVTKVVFVDDPSNVTANSSNPRVLYECVVLGGFASGQIISNCRLSSSLGGNFNFYERTLRAASKNVSKTKLTDQDGDIVLVQFIQGHTAYPSIVSLDNGIDTESSIGASSSDGQIVDWQYNGVNAEIDKNGNLTLTRRGGSYDADNKFFTPVEGGKKVEVKVLGQSIVMTMENGLVVTIDGATDKMTVVTKAGTKIRIDGKTDEVKLETSAGAKLDLKAGKVALGAGSTEVLDKLSKVADLVSQWATNVGAVHTHIGNLGYPTLVPDQASGYTTLGSDLAAVKAAVDGIKGTL